MYINKPLHKYLKIQKTINNKYIFTETPLTFKINRKKSRINWNSYDYKLDSSISRAKNSILNICNFNKFDFFYTQTISSIYVRNDLKSLITKFSQITRDLRKKHKNEKFYYLLIPEYHSDKRNWHLHGFLSSGYNLYRYKNDNGFYSFSCFDSLGWNSGSIIRDYSACIYYSMKYITKDIVSNLKKGERIYYCSKNLLRENIICKMNTSQIAPIHYDFKSPFCFKTTLDEKRYYKFVTDIDTLDRFQYYLIN